MTQARSEGASSGTKLDASASDDDARVASSRRAPSDAGREPEDESDRPEQVNAEGAAPSDQDDANEATQESEDDAALLDSRLDEPEPAGRSKADREYDSGLVERAQAGDRRAFRELFERHHKRAFSVAFGVLKNQQDALDVVQDAFVKVHRHLPNFQGTSSFYTWLYRIVMNLSIDQLRRKKTQKPVEYDDTVSKEDELIDASISPRSMNTSPRSAVVRRELMERVAAALETLPEHHRQVIVLREVDGLSYEEMAEVLEVPKGTIMSRLFHARKKMQIALEDYVQGDLDVEE